MKKTLAICQGVCRVQAPRSLFAAGPYEVCLSCLNSAAWAAERRRREAEAKPAEDAQPMRRVTVRG